MIHPIKIGTVSTGAVDWVEVTVTSSGMVEVTHWGPPSPTWSMGAPQAKALARLLEVAAEVSQAERAR